MATREKLSPSERVPNRTAKRRPQTNKLSRAGKEKHAVGSVSPVSEGVELAIETERDNLSKAESLLGCLAIAMEHGAWEHEDEVVPPYYPDVARMARDLVRRSINALDCLHLEKHLARRRIKETAETYGMSAGLQAGAAHHWIMRLDREPLLLSCRQAM